jgi:hypothetical protein
MTLNVTASMLSSMLLSGQSQIEPIWERRLQGMGVDAQDQAQVIRFLGQAHPEQERHSQICFILLVTAVAGD